MHKTITVLGAGYVGLTSATLFAHAGYTVYLVEPNPKRLEVIKSGKSFFFEQGINALISEAVKKGMLIPTDSYAEAIPKSFVTFSCVGTPDNPDGSSNLSYVFSSAKEAAAHAQPGMIYVQKSTVPVGTGEKVEAQFTTIGAKIGYVSNPEFLREGTAISDTLYFDRVIAGSDNLADTKAVLDIYRELEKHRGTITKKAALLPNPRRGSYVATSRNSAELIKVTANAFLALKISFANSIAKLADQANADINEVMDGVGADRRIGRAFLNAGRGYGGGCFPKDVSGLISSGLAYGVDLEIMQAVQGTNKSMPGYIVEKLKYKLSGSLKNKKVVVLGLAFKTGTSDVRKSPGITIANLLTEHGAAVTTYDPQANDEATEDLARNITIKTSLENALSKSDAIIVATDWDEFKNAPLKTYKACAPILVDAMNCFNPSDVKEAGITYIGVGRS